MTKKKDDHKKLKDNLAELVNKHPNKANDTLGINKIPKKPLAEIRKDTAKKHVFK